MSAIENCKNRIKEGDARTYVEILGGYYSQVKEEQLSEETIRKARITLFDFLTVLLVGRKYTVLSPLCRTYLNSKKTGEECVALGLNIKTSQELAALAMGIVSHGVELDDGQRSSSAHPAVAILPCIMAVAQKNNNTLDEIVKSIVLAYDCMLRVACAINPSHVSRGFHPTSTCGPIGAAMAAASLNHLGGKETVNAIGIGALQGAGIQEMLHCDASSIKPLQPGKAAMAGVIAAEFAALGAKTPLLVFEGELGWLNAMADEYDETVLIGGLGESWYSDYCYTKLYPSCRYIHAPIDIALQFRSQEIDWRQIERMELYMSKYAIAEVGLIKRPVCFEEALYSAAYSIALALVYGKVRIEEIYSGMRSDEILALSEKVQVIEDEEQNQRHPKESGARIVLVTRDGGRYDQFLPVAKADYDTPITDEEYIGKARSTLEGDVAEKEIQVLWDLVVESDRKAAACADIVRQMVKMADTASRE